MTLGAHAESSSARGTVNRLGSLQKCGMPSSAREGCRVPSVGDRLSVRRPSLRGRRKCRLAKESGYGMRFYKCGWGLNRQHPHLSFRAFTLRPRCRWRYTKPTSPVHRDSRNDLEHTSRDPTAGRRAGNSRPRALASPDSANQADINVCEAVNFPIPSRRLRFRRAPVVRMPSYGRCARHGLAFFILQIMFCGRR